MTHEARDATTAAVLAMVAAGDHDGAVQRLQQALAADDDPVVRDLAAGLAYFEGDYPQARQHLEAAFRGHRDEGEARRAARDAMELAEMHFSLFGNAAASNGWLARATRLLDTVGECVEWGYLELAIMACSRPDVADLERSAERALAIAHAFGDADLEVRALADGGLALVCQGRLHDGFARLDEALAVLSAGDARQPETAAKSMCSLLTSCDRAGDLHRADEWTRLVAAAVLTPGRGRPAVLAEHCRLVQCGLLSAAGRWDEAEATLAALLATMAGSAPHRVETMARLAELRLHRGQLDAAADLIAPHEDAVVMRAPLARLHLLRNEPEQAIAVAEMGLRDLVADRLRGAPLLEVVVQAHLCRGDRAAAAAAAARLTTLAEQAESAAVRADAALARGRVAAASGRLDVAAEELMSARQAFAAAARPLQAGVARLELAGLLRDMGDPASAVVEARAALAVFERLGAGTLVDQAARLLRALGSPVRTRADVTSVIDGLTPREAEVLDLVRRGLTNAEIGQRLFISAKTAEHHVGRLLTKLGVRTRTEAAALAAAATRHGDQERAE